MIPAEPAALSRIFAMAATRASAAWGARVLASLLLSLGSAAALEAQGIGANRLSGFRLELGVAASTPLVEDGNGVSVRRGIGAAAGGDAMWTIGERTLFVAAVRGSIAPLHLRSMERRWSGGWTQQFDLALRVERNVAGTMGIGAGLVAALLHGPDDVIPFRAGRGGVYGWGPEVAVSRRISREPGLHMVLAGDAVRISPTAGDARLVGGWIGRLRLVIRHVV